METEAGEDPSDLPTAAKLRHFMRHGTQEQCDAIAAFQARQAKDQVTVGA